MYSLPRCLHLAFVLILLVSASLCLLLFFGVIPSVSSFAMCFCFISYRIALPLNGGLYVFAFCFPEVATLDHIEARTGGWHSPLRDDPKFWKIKDVL